MPKKTKSEEDFTKASIKVKDKKILEKAAEKEGLYEYELIEKLLKDNYQELFRNGRQVTA